MYLKILFFAYTAIMFLMSVVAFFTFLRDKKLAEKGKIRIKEKTLLGMTAFGGALGAFLGRLAARHKTNKVYFSIMIIFSLILQLAVFAFLLWAMLAN